MIPAPGHNSDPYNYGDRIDELVTQLQLERDERRKLEALNELSTTHARDPRAVLAINKSALTNSSDAVRTAANNMLAPKPSTDYNMPSWQKYGLLGVAILVGVWAVRDLRK